MLGPSRLVNGPWLLLPRSIQYLMIRDKSHLLNLMVVQLIERQRMLIRLMMTLLYTVSFLQKQLKIQL